MAFKITLFITTTDAFIDVCLSLASSLFQMNPIMHPYVCKLVFYFINILLILQNNNNIKGLINERNIKIYKNFML